MAAVVLSGVPATPLPFGNGACSLQVASPSVVLPTAATATGYVVDLRIPELADPGSASRRAALVAPGTGALGIDVSNGLLMAVGR